MDYGTLWMGDPKIRPYVREIKGLKEDEAGVVQYYNRNQKIKIIESVSAENLISFMAYGIQIPSGTELRAKMIVLKTNSDLLWEGKLVCQILETYAPREWSAVSILQGGTIEPLSGQAPVDHWHTTVKD